ncbi:OX-2 membrane glycoprotein-like isoform X1 [Pygocentrus nattereri]|uniref:OX-2 membrane glycoprotein-like isoform X1 n=1 Tax=Pygocentrus nattereri TaxID=42514 RepID=UPI0008142FD2|nr:OX-2 membrane glycoprotein-like isoform X1 [Pygocentrus nattereri]
MMLDYTVFLSLLTLAGCAALVTEEKVIRDFGESASFSCSLPNAAGVKQVTWQRLGHDDSVHTMVTFSENFKQQVADAYLDKVEVTEATLSSSTIVMKNITFADEGCYICTFNVYPSGTERRKTCLTVQGLSDITTTFLDKTENKVVVSCSATGKPAPEVRYIDKEIESGERVTVINVDGTITSTKNLTLLRSPAQYVECVAESGNMLIRKRINLTDDQQQDPGEKNEAPRHYPAFFVVVIAIIGAISTGIVLHRRKVKAECGKERIEETV